MSIPKEVRAGIVAIVALGLLYWGINYLKGKDVFNDQKLAYAVYERVDGLTPARPVLINGFQVGQVNQVYFHPAGDGRLVVEISINTDFKIPKNTIAKINSQNLLGDKNINLILGDAMEYVSSGDTLTSDIAMSLTEEVNKQVLPLKQKAENLIGSIDSAMILLTGFLNERTRKNFMATFESVRKSFETLEHTTVELDKLITENRSDVHDIVGNVKAISESLGDNADELAQIIDNTGAITDTLSKARIGRTMTALNRSLEQADTILTKINKGEGTIGMLVNDPELYEDLLSASEELNMLLLDIQYNPQRYLHFSVFGSSKEYDSEELQRLADEKEKQKEEKEASEETQEEDPPEESEEK